MAIIDVRGSHIRVGSGVMTDGVWRVSTDPRAMLEAVQGRASDRKLRLFAVALAREAADPPFDPVIPIALDAAELRADGRLSPSEEERVDGLTNATSGRLIAEYGRSLRDWPAAARESWLLALAAYLPPLRWLREPASISYRAFGGSAGPRQPRLLREVVGNPCRHVTADPTWLTPAVVSVGHAIYTEKAFDRLPVLADALEGAGCKDADLLAHCRWGAPHVRGCWAIDLVTGRE